MFAIIFFSSNAGRIIFHLTNSFVDKGFQTLLVLEIISNVVTSSEVS